MSTAKTNEELAEKLRSEERKRRRREGWVILIAALMILLFAFFEDLLPDVAADYSLTSNIAFFLLVNINIILLVLLVFLVARNLLKLVLDRRRRNPGLPSSGQACVGLHRHLTGAHGDVVPDCRKLRDPFGGQVVSTPKS